jgi:multiple sugar transport system permease protein
VSTAETDPEAAGPRLRTRRRSTLARREARLAYAFVSPAVIVVVVVVLFPIVWNIVLSLQDISLVELRNVNFFNLELTTENYQDVVSGDFWPLLLRTLVYAIAGTSLALIMGLWAALVVRKTFIGRRFVRGLLLFPYVIPAVAAALLWRTMLNPQYGIVNAWLEAMGFQSVNFLLQSTAQVSLLGFDFSIPLAFTIVILFEAWRSFPFALLFLLARLQAIPSDIEEAAMVDGATPSQRFRYIILPELKGVFAVLFLLRFIWTFNAFDEIYLLTAGSAGTKVVSVQIYEWLFGRSDVGAAAALSLVLALTLAVSLFVYFRWFYTEETE